MPEGDTIHKLARSMSSRLLGQTLIEISVQGRGTVGELAGQPVTEVTALGKHLLIAIADRWVLRTHLGIHGAWHHYVPHQRWRGPPQSAVAQLSTARHVYVCFRAPQVELMPRTALTDHPVLSRVGPDLLAERFDVEVVVRRARAERNAACPLGELLLDQGVASGLGNVYKSELLFIRRLHPWTPAGAVSDDQLRALYQLGRRLLQANLGPGRRVTTIFAPAGQRARNGRPRTWVYRRAPNGCLVCADRIQTGRQGDLNRSTYWCPRCQPRAAE